MMLEMILEHDKFDIRAENVHEINNLLNIINGKISERALQAIF